MNGQSKPVIRGDNEANNDSTYETLLCGQVCGKIQNRNTANNFEAFNCTSIVLCELREKKRKVSLVN